MPKAKTAYTEPEIIPRGADWPRTSWIWVSTGPIGCFSNDSRVIRVLRKKSP
jgi:hypothetical protein